MAENIQRLNSGQSPTLLQASKGNELIDAINSLRNSKSSQRADSAGISLKVTSGGSLELDVDSDTLAILNPQDEQEDAEATTDIPEGYVEQRVNAISNGIPQGIIILVKTG